MDDERWYKELMDIATSLPLNSDAKQYKERIQDLEYEQQTWEAKEQLRNDVKKAREEFLENFEKLFIYDDSWVKEMMSSAKRNTHKITHLERRLREAETNTLSDKEEKHTEKLRQYKEFYTLDLFPDMVERDLLYKGSDSVYILREDCTVLYDALVSIYHKFQQLSVDDLFKSDVAVNFAMRDEKDEWKWLTYFSVLCDALKNGKRVLAITCLELLEEFMEFSFYVSTPFIHRTRPNEDMEMIDSLIDSVVYYYELLEKLETLQDDYANALSKWQHTRLLLNYVPEGILDILMHLGYEEVASRLPQLKVYYPLINYAKQDLNRCYELLGELHSKEQELADLRKKVKEMYEDDEEEEVEDVTVPDTESEAEQEDVMRMLSEVRDAMHQFENRFNQMLIENIDLMHDMHYAVKANVTKIALIKQNARMGLDFDPTDMIIPDFRWDEEEEKTVGQMMSAGQEIRRSFYDFFLGNPENDGFYEIIYLMPEDSNHCLDELMFSYRAVTDKSCLEAVNSRAYEFFLTRNEDGKPLLLVYLDVLYDALKTGRLIKVAVCTIMFRYILEVAFQKPASDNDTHEQPGDTQNTWEQTVFETFRLLLEKTDGYYASLERFLALDDSLSECCEQMSKCISKLKSMPEDVRNTLAVMNDKKDLDRIRSDDEMKQYYADVVAAKEMLVQCAMKSRKIYFVKLEMNDWFDAVHEQFKAFLDLFES